MHPNLVSSVFKPKLAKLISNLENISIVKGQVFGSASKLPTQPGIQMEGIDKIFSLPLHEGDLLQEILQNKHGSHSTKKILSYIPGKKIKFLNPDWNSNVMRLLGTAMTKLCVDKTSVSLHLDKVVISREGEAFPSTKLPSSVFAKLIIQLPSQYNGGSIIFENGKEEFNFNNTAPNHAATYQNQFACFLTDVTHEIRPITSGIRTLCVFHCSWKSQTPKPQSSANRDYSNFFANLLPSWDIGKNYLLIPMTDCYTPESFKGKKVAEVLDWEDEQILSGLVKANEILSPAQRIDIQIAELHRTVMEEKPNIPYNSHYYDSDDESHNTYSITADDREIFPTCTANGDLLTSSNLINGSTDEHLVVEDVEEFWEGYDDGERDYYGHGNVTANEASKQTTKLQKRSAESIDLTLPVSKTSRKNID